jgi:hypothetical protein
VNAGERADDGGRAVGGVIAGVEGERATDEDVAVA